MRITIMGSGGVGGYFGARLAQAGHAVSFVARGRHLAAIREHGPTPHHRRTWAPIVQPELPLEV